MAGAGETHRQLTAISFDAGVYDFWNNHLFFKHMEKGSCQASIAVWSVIYCIKRKKRILKRK